MGNKKAKTILSIYDDLMGLMLGSSRYVDNIINTAKNGEDKLTQMAIDKEKTYVKENE